jgi:hypothetical protein
MNVRPCYVAPQEIQEQGTAITVIDVNDECVLSSRVKNEMYKYYLDARLAQLKVRSHGSGQGGQGEGNGSCSARSVPMTGAQDGGNFPYLSRPTEVNVFLRVGARAWVGNGKRGGVAAAV